MERIASPLGSWAPGQLVPCACTAPCSECKSSLAFHGQHKYGCLGKTWKGEHLLHCPKASAWDSACAVPPWHSKWNRECHEAESLADTNCLNVRNTSLYFTLSKIIHQSITKRQTNHGKTSPCTVCGKEGKLLSPKISLCIQISLYFYRGIFNIFIGKIFSPHRYNSHRYQTWYLLTDEKINITWSIWNPPPNTSKCKKW